MALRSWVVGAELIADVGAAIAVRVSKKKWRPIDGQVREVVVQVRGDLPTRVVARMLRELADAVEG